MTMLRYEPAAGLNRDIWTEFSKFFDRVNNDESTGATAEWMPPVDIAEYPDRYALHADVPGVDPSAIEITLENGVLTLSGSREKVVETNGNGAESRRVERVTGRFLRRFTLPESVDAEGVKASGKHGVLEIVIPKRATAQARKITVKA
jgi:HSP20 family protein